MFSSAEFIGKSVDGNHICTPAVLARTALYREAGMFPKDLPYAGEWYLWLKFAMSGPVGYTAEPGAHYRQHPGSNTAIYRAQNASIIVRDEVEVRWRIRLDLENGADPLLLQLCNDGISRDYARRAFLAIRQQSPFGLSVAAVEQSIADHTRDAAVRSALLGRFHEFLGDLFLTIPDVRAARGHYLSANRLSPRLGTLAKLSLSCLGQSSLALRRAIASWKAGAPPVAERSGGVA